MLDAMRRGVANLLAKVLLGLLILAFAIWGIGDYIVRGPQQGALATVGKVQISEEDLRQAYNEELQAIVRRLGRTLTPEQAQILGVPPRALARLIGTAAINQHAHALGITVTDNVVASIIKGAHPEIVGAGGKIDMSKYIELVRQSGFRSLGEYEAARKEDLLREQLTETLGAGAATQQFLLDAIHRYRDEKRVIEYVAPDFSKLVTVAEPPQEKLKAFFEQNRRKYLALEERKANLLLVSRDMAMQRVKVGDEEVKAAYETAKGTYDVPEKRRILQLTFPDKAAAEKAYAELAKAKDFNGTAAKLGFSASDMQLGAGLLKKAEMIDPKIADAAFKLKKDELSRPVEGQYSVVLLRVPEIVEGKTRTFDEVKGEIRDHIAAERVGQQLQALHERVEAGRAKGTPLKEIAEEMKLPLLEVAGLTRTGKTGDGRTLIAHADAARIAEAVFAAVPAVETEVIELGDGGYAWFDLLDVTPERQRTFEEAAGEAKASFMEEERRKQIASLVSKQIEERKPGEGLERIAKALNAKIERTPPLKRGATPPAGLTAALLQQAFGMAKGDVASAATADGKGRVVFRVADIVAAPAASANETAAIREELTKQIRLDALDQYVSGLRTRYGVTMDEKRLARALQALGGQSVPSDN
jgi:peptidyl-prolyl cis-trans isomerase D